MMDLTEGQIELIDKVVRWYRNGNEQDFVYAGPAGTGKTTVLKYIIDRLGLRPHEVLFIAYTGKAASVLMQKGFDAYTIHSAMFDLVEVPMVRDGKILVSNGRDKLELKFKEKDSLDKHIKLIVLDEWSMVDENLMRVIYKFGIPVLASGDEFQLRPISGECLFADRIKYRLTEITRQAKDSGIITLATLIREGMSIPKNCNFNDDAYVMDKSQVTDKILLDADMILTSKNKTRNMFNNKIRTLRGSIGKLPNVGDKLICRKNNRAMSLRGIPLINGTVGKLIHPIQLSECQFSRGLYKMDFKPDYIDDDDDTYYENMLCDYNFLIGECGEKFINEYNKGAKMEFAEAITVHLSQGSQYMNIVYWDEWIGDADTMRKLRYTAITRASEKVYMFM